MASAPESNAPVRNAKVVSETQARQGVTGHNVRYVLTFGTLGVALAFVIIYALFF